MARYDWKAACAYGVRTGREAGVHEMNVQLEQADRLFDRVMAIPAATHAGRAANVRALMAHVIPQDWRGEGDVPDWDTKMARALLGEFSGLSAAELAGF